MPPLACRILPIEPFLRAGVVAFGLALADLLGQGVALRLQVLGAGLDALALGFERAEAINVEKGLRLLAAFQPRNHAGEVAAQQVDVEHERALLAMRKV